MMPNLLKHSGPIIFLIFLLLFTPSSTPWASDPPDECSALNDKGVTQALPGVYQLLFQDETCPEDCDLLDGWHNTGDVGPGCNELDDPLAEQRDYTCSSGECIHSVTETLTCNAQDGTYGGGDAGGCGTDPMAQQRDYFVNDDGGCDFTTTNCLTKTCDSMDACYNTCDGNVVRSYKDYYVQPVSGVCSSTFGTTVEDCATKPSTDTDGSPTGYLTGGTVSDYTVCTSGSCPATSYNDYCSGDFVYEYGASGPDMVGPTGYDCENYESNYCSEDRYLYRDQWGCTGFPGYCYDATDTLETDCGVDQCVGTCGTGANGCTYHLRGCSGGACFDDAYDADTESDYCTDCSLVWGIGGEVAPASCCGDDADEFQRTCVDSSANGSCGGDTDACCQTGSDCVDHNGNCRDGGSCYVFGTGGLYSHCSVAGIWQDPDESSAYCTGSGCGFDWLTNGTGSNSKCCGDDPGEDFEQTEGVGRSCCYNGSLLPHGSSSGSLLCYQGLLYDCNGAATDDSGLGEHVLAEESIGPHLCLDSNLWV